jgi:hypothetical protein
VINKNVNLKKYIMNSVFLSSDCHKNNYCTSLNSIWPLSSRKMYKSSNIITQI